MPKLWFVHGELAHTSHKGSAVPISFTDFNTAFGEKAARFFSGNPPGFNAHTPPMGPQHVVLEVGADEIKPPVFLRPGYYLVEGLSPAAAETALRTLGIID
jgi:hypothetical protein